MKDCTDITILLDRTGSMEQIKADTIGGFNRFLSEQQAVPGDALLSLIQFDSQDPFEVVYKASPIKDAKPLTVQTYIPRAMTPLLDAIGRTVNDIGARIGALSGTDRPDKVILVILTDGLENASKEFTQEKVFQMLKHQQEVYKWQVVYLGANQDAIAEGAKIGSPFASSMTYAPTTDGTRAVYAAASAGVAEHRVSGKGVTFTEEQRKKAVS